MTTESTKHEGLALPLLAYFVLLVVVVGAVIWLLPGARDHLPLGGTNDEIRRILGLGGDVIADGSVERGLAERGAVALTLAAHLLFTVALMIPVTWVFMATHRESGYRQNFVFSLIVMPIVVSAVVMLVQGNLALAFGLAAMVAAVRFRVSLSGALEGIYVFAAIAVGLACGIGFAGVAYVMVFFFCFANVYMWRTGFGYNEAEVARRKAKQLRRERANQDSAD